MAYAHSHSTAHGAGFAARISRMIGGLKDTARRSALYRQTRRELDGLSDRDLADLGIQPTDMDSVIPEYLWCYRPSGQYAAIKESAKNLRKA